MPLNLENLFNSLSGASILLDRDLYIVAASDEYLRTGSFRRDQIVGKHLFTAFPDNPNDPSSNGVQQLRASIERVLKTGKPDLMPVLKYDIPDANSKSGFDERWWKTTNAPVFGDHGLIDFILHTTIDVTASAKLERLHSAAREDIRKSAVQTLVGGGEMGTLMRAKNFADTPLGPIESWPQSLRTAVGIMLDNKFGMYIAWGTDFIQLYNDGYRPILGTTKHPHALANKASTTFAESWQIIEPLFQQVMRGESVGSEDWLLPLDRHGYLEDCYFTFSYSPIRIESGEVGGVLVTVTETTEHVRARRINEDRRDELTTTLKALPQILWTARPDGAADFYNDRWFEYTGWNLDQTRDWGWKPLMHPDDFESAMEGLQTSIKNGQAWENEHRLLRASDQSWRWHLVRSVPIRDDNGAILKWVGTATDIHDQHTSRKEVVDILDSMNDGFFSVDKDFRITNVNARHAELTRVPKEKQIGRYFFDVFPDANNPETKYWIEYHRAMNDRVICQFEDFYAPLDLWTAVSVFPKSGGGFAAFFRDITRDKRAVAKIANQSSELKTVQERFQRSAKATDLGVWYCDLPFDVLIWNDEVKNHFFLPPDAHVTIDTFYERMHPDDREKTKAAIEKSISLNGPYDTLFRTLDRESSEFKWIRAIGWTDYNDRNEAIRFDGITLDVTKVLAREEELRKLELAERSRLEQILKYTPVSTALLVGPMHRFVFANENYEKILLGGKRVVGKTVAEILPEAIAQGYGDLLDRVYATGESYEGRETRIHLLQPDGTEREFYLNFRYEATRDEKGEVDGILGSVIDVTEQVRAREQLQISEANFRAITEATPQIVWTASPDGAVDYANNLWYEYTGFSPNETMGDKFLGAIHPDDVQTTIDKYGESLRTLNPLQIEHRFRRADGVYRWFLTRAVPTLDEHGKAQKWFGTNVDIEEQKRVAVELLIAKDEAERANNAKSSFLANMSHEIRSPLGAIMGFSELLKNQDLTTEQHLGFVSVIERNSTHLLRVIDDILDLSKVEAGKILFETIDFSFPDLMSDFASLMGFKAKEKGIEFQLKVQTQIPNLLTTDPTRLRQILNNVVGNAIKFTERGRVQLTVSYADHRMEFTVTDTGVGISESEAKKLFQVFQQADVSTTRKYGGTGLGLVLTRKLCETLGGHFELQSSQLGRGSTFVASLRVALPKESKLIDARDFEVTVRPTQPVMPSLPVLLDAKILVVEDSPDNQILFDLFLSKAGALVEFANDGHDGVNSALTNSYDLLLMDVQMPRMDGHEATRELRRRGFTKPIIALTAHAMKEERDRAFASGFTDFLSKPVQREALIEMILKYK